MTAYCLIVETAYPDYKRPGVGVHVSHHTSLLEAKDSAKKQVENYVYDYHDICAKVYNDEEKFREFIFIDSYMDNPPIHIEIRELECKSPGVIHETNIHYKVVLDVKNCKCSECNSIF